MRFTANQLAGCVYSATGVSLSLDPDFDPLAEARRINANEGFTIEISEDNQLRGNVIRYEGVRVSDDRLIAAYHLAMDWMFAHRPDLAAFMKAHYR